jgi:hypothetical protein
MASHGALKNCKYTSARGSAHSCSTARESTAQDNTRLPAPIGLAVLCMGTSLFTAWRDAHHAGGHRDRAISGGAGVQADVFPLRNTS